MYYNAILFSILNRYQPKLIILDVSPYVIDKKINDKERLENLLDAVNNEEKKVQEKMNGRKVKGKPIQNEKDW